MLEGRKCDFRCFLRKRDLSQSLAKRRLVSANSCLESLFESLRILSKTDLMCTGKFVDSFRYPKVVFYRIQSQFKVRNWAAIKFMDFRQIGKKSRFFSSFHLQRARSLNSKGSEKCFVYPQKHTQCVQGNLVIYLYTHRVHFRALETDLELNV